MKARMQSVFGWIRRRLEDLRVEPARAKNRRAHVPSVFDSLEQRKVLSTTSFSPIVALPVGAVSPVPISYHGQSSVPSVSTVRASAIMPVINEGQTVQLSSAAVQAVEPNVAYVESLYPAVLGRAGGPGEVASWVVKMDEGMSVQAVAQGFVNSLEHREEQVDAYYEEFLHRAPDTGSAGWVQQLMDGVSDEMVVEGILDSAEYQSADADPSLYVHDLYLDVLGRHGEPAGVTAWHSALQSGTSRQAVAADFVQSAEANDQIIESFYTSYLHRTRDEPGSEVWVNQLASGSSASSVAVGILSSQEFLQNSQ